MIAKFTIFAILVLSLATYASSPVGHASPQMAAPCCDGDPTGIP